MSAWYESRFTGLCTEFAAVTLRPYDPDVPQFTALVPSPFLGQGVNGGSGAGWDRAAAEAACAGEAIERCQAHCLPSDRTALASWQDWPLAEPAVAPGSWVLYHPEQYALPWFPFRPLRPDTVCQWVCCRQAGTGQPWWVPADLVYLWHAPAPGPRLCPGTSTGLVCGRWGGPVLLRGVQEIIERDAVLGAWWGSYPLEEWPAADVLDTLDPSIPPRILRPNLRYRFYRARSPFSAHVTLVTLEGEDGDGYAFRMGTACRETRRASWLKSILEAVQGIAYLRYLKTRPRTRETGPHDVPADFHDHALYYSLHPERLAQTVLASAAPAAGRQEGATESLAILKERLGPGRPVLFRNLTPPGIAAELRDWYVLRVLVPGLQPLHPDHRLPFLGGPLWRPRGLAEWADMPPHPFP
jgi:ribosomal protein S12 methylthiotransferase accessory factor